MDDDAPIICPTTGTYCVRAFCDDYGCANQAGVPIDKYDVDPRETVIPLLKVKRKRRKDRRQKQLI